MLQAPTLHTDVYAFFQGRAYRPPFLQGSLAPGRVTVLSPLPASQSPTGSPCLWIRESMASLFSRGKAFRLGWGRGIFQGGRVQPCCAQDPFGSGCAVLDGELGSRRGEEMRAPRGPVHSQPGSPQQLSVFL